MNKNYTLLKRAAVIGGLILGAFAFSALADWSAPLNAPPTCPAGNAGCDAPINVGTSAQVKNGGLSVNAFTAYANAYFAGSVGIGTQPTAGNQLDVEGNPIKAGGGLIIETRASDPASPATGRMWLITP